MSIHVAVIDPLPRYQQGLRLGIVLMGSITRYDHEKIIRAILDTTW